MSDKNHDDSSYEYADESIRQMCYMLHREDKRSSTGILAQMLSKLIIEYSNEDTEKPNIMYLFFHQFEIPMYFLLELLKNPSDDDLTHQIAIRSLSIIYIVLRQVYKLEKQKKQQKSTNLHSLSPSDRFISIRKSLYYSILNSKSENGSTMNTKENTETNTNEIQDILYIPSCIEISKNKTLSSVSYSISPYVFAIRKQDMVPLLVALLKYPHRGIVQLSCKILVLLCDISSRFIDDIAKYYICSCIYTLLLNVENGIYKEYSDVNTNTLITQIINSLTTDKYLIKKEVQELYISNSWIEAKEDILRVIIDLVNHISIKEAICIEIYEGDLYSVLWELYLLYYNHSHLAASMLFTLLKLSVYINNYHFILSLPQKTLNILIQNLLSTNQSIVSCSLYFIYRCICDNNIDIWLSSDGFLEGLVNVYVNNSSNNRLLFLDILQRLFHFHPSQSNNPLCISEPPYSVCTGFYSLYLTQIFSLFYVAPPAMYPSLSLSLYVRCLRAFAPSYYYFNNEYHQLVLARNTVSFLNKKSSSSSNSNLPSPYKPKTNKKTTLFSYLSRKGSSGGIGSKSDSDSDDSDSAVVPPVTTNTVNSNQIRLHRPTPSNNVISLDSDMISITPKPLLLEEAKTKNNNRSYTLKNAGSSDSLVHISEVNFRTKTNKNLLKEEVENDEDKETNEDSPKVVTSGNSMKNTFQSIQHTLKGFSSDSIQRSLLLDQSIAKQYGIHIDNVSNTDKIKYIDEDSPEFNSIYNSICLKYDRIEERTSSIQTVQYYTHLNIFETEKDLESRVCRYMFIEGRKEWKERVFVLSGRYILEYKTNQLETLHKRYDIYNSHVIISHDKLGKHVSNEPYIVIMINNKPILAFYPYGPLPLLLWYQSIAKIIMNIHFLPPYQRQIASDFDVRDSTTTFQGVEYINNGELPLLPLDRLLDKQCIDILNTLMANGGVYGYQYILRIIQMIQSCGYENVCQLLYSNGLQNISVYQNIVYNTQLHAYVKSKSDRDYVKNLVANKAKYIYLQQVCKTYYEMKKISFYKSGSIRRHTYDSLKRTSLMLPSFNTTSDSMNTVIKQKMTNKDIYICRNVDFNIPIAILQLLDVNQNDDDDYVTIGDRDMNSTILYEKKNGVERVYL